jgi:hypothetical protein
MLRIPFYFGYLLEGLLETWLYLKTISKSGKLGVFLGYVLKSMALPPGVGLPLVNFFLAFGVAGA